MLVSIGSKRRAEQDLVDVLLECHQRIRNFVRIATDVGRRADLPASEVLDACAQVERYFKEALPLHVEDEDKSLAPRLRGLRADVDGALSAMSAQHLHHTPGIADLFAALSSVRSAPLAPEARAQLLAAASRLSVEFEEHLALEERVIFPAIRALLSAEQQAEVRQELRARRSKDLSHA